MPTPLQIIMQQSQVAAQRDAFDRQRVAQSQSELNNALPQMAHNLPPLMPPPPNQVAPIDWAPHDKASAALVLQEAGANNAMAKERQTADDRGRVNLALQRDKSAGQMALDAFKAKLKPRVLMGGPKARATQAFLKLWEKTPANDQEAEQRAGLLREAYLHVPPQDRQDLLGINIHPDLAKFGTKRADVIAEKEAAAAWHGNVGNTDARVAAEAARYRHSLDLHSKDAEARVLAAGTHDPGVDEAARAELAQRVRKGYGADAAASEQAAAPTVVAVNRALGKVRLSDGTVRDATPADFQ